MISGPTTRASRAANRQAFADDFRPSHQRFPRGRLLATAEGLAAARAQPLSALIVEIDASRGDANLSSAIRVFVLESAPQ